MGQKGWERMGRGWEGKGKGKRAREKGSRLWWKEKSQRSTTQWQTQTQRASEWVSEWVSRVLRLVHITRTELNCSDQVDCVSNDISFSTKMENGIWASSFYRASYASAVLGVVILSVRLSVRHTRALWLIQRTYRRYFLYHMKGQSF